ncbi:FAD/NAD(P)-binding domain-containing protein [Pluteus cervinus]|uniref:FAD/NAD(P)-binding domain-containing protein n=1 Tax=Pluteus cervinus TaxID=181527 RepID=A0ACD3BCT8_9AGAR|nr:FAD/NAD(P)-binding domain-containing protein [Pluteus cervinus]
MSKSHYVASLPPKHAQILVIGGGPAGAYAASALAREGHSVTVLEAAKFPRYHIGESLIPSVRHYLRFIGAEDKLVNHGFIPKPGAVMKFNQYKREGYTDFVALGHNNNSWNVIRSEFDHILLNHARVSGAAVYEQTKVTDITFSQQDPDQPVSICWSHTPPPLPMSPPASPSAYMRGDPRTDSSQKDPTITGSTSFTYLVDASGRAGVLSTRYFKNRHFNASLKNIAVWGYWTAVGTYGEGTTRQGAPYFEALTDESGWAWFIPLHNGTTSVGVVMNHKEYQEKGKQGSTGASTPILDKYLSNLQLAPSIVKLVTENGRLDGTVQFASDYSYSAPSYAGAGYRIVGDAGAFIDPFFSSGVHLALTSALSAASSICASIRGQCSEAFAALWHTKRVATSYTRFQIVVLSAYKQIRAQSDGVLSDVDEDNYDRAFSFLRPVIQGASDVGARLSENELQKSLDFCVNLFNPSLEQHQHLLPDNPLVKDLVDVERPFIDPRVLDQVMAIPELSFSATQDTPEAHADSDAASEFQRVIETKMLLDKINARRLIHAEYGLHNLEEEPLDGYAVRLEVGDLGLIQVQGTGSQHQ